MTDRERLIELIRKAKKNTKGANCDLEREMLFADYLLVNGVTVPPCKVGDMVYSLWSVPTETKYIVYCAEVKKISQYKKNCRLTSVFEIEPIEFRGRRKEYLFEDFGKTVFLTREEAEKAIAERSLNDA